jgi:ketosteroid isomerase-like protein
MDRRKFPYALPAAGGVFALLLFATHCPAEVGSISASAQRGIDVGNQAWVEGMKEAKAAFISGTYATNALDCGSSGECTKGRVAIGQHLRLRLMKSGRALTASVTSKGAVQQGDFVYEWGRADATFAKGKKEADEYLTVWHRDTDGNWRIFRNMVIPSEKR